MLRLVSPGPVHHFRSLRVQYDKESITYLGDHHMAVKGTLAHRCRRLFDVWSDHCYDRSAKGHVGHKVAVHDIYVKPICSVADGVGACLSQRTKVGR